MKRALLFDLDETLIVEEPVAEEAFRAAAQAVGRCGIEPDTLAEDVRTRARELWYAAPTHDYSQPAADRGT